LDSEVSALSNLIKGLILLLVVLGIGIGLVFWKNKVGHSASPENGISKEEIELLLADLAKENPAFLKRFGENPEMKKEQLDNLRELFALASGARAEGYANEPQNKQELDNIRSQIIAVNYDREINKDKGPMPPFGFIDENRIKAFWGEGEQPDKGFFGNLKDKIGLGKQDNELAFQRFLDSKVQLLKSQNPEMADREISEEEKKQARDIYAKIEIYEQEYADKAAAGQLDETFRKKVDLQVKLQQAQFLARIYSDKVADKLKVTDEEVDQYIAEHPEYSGADKKAKAQEILQRARSGEDFAKLANEFSDDPGNKNPKGELQGGFYGNNPKGRMVPQFEQAALALEPGQITQELVETDYGFHIIKLERKGMGKDDAGKEAETYDVRHILISSGIKDPNNPTAREMPPKMFVRQKLEEEKQKKLIDELIAKNGVSVPDDFTVPTVTDEQIEEAMQKQRKQMEEMQGAPGAPGAPGEAGPDAPPPPPPSNARPANPRGR
jgi:parvulin-like peptidyl-prolyl isomerase